MKKTILFFAISIIALNLSAQLKVDANNKIGIGTTTPNQKLHVVGNAVFTATNSSPNTSPFIIGSEVWSTESNPSYTWYSSSNTGIYHPSAGEIGFALNGNESMLLSPGSIKIKATTDWSRTLWISATSSSQAGYHMNLNGVDNFWVQANGNAYARFWGVLSDEKYKREIVTIPNALEKVLKLRGVTFYWKDKETDQGKNMGLIAQEVEKVVPEVVRISIDGNKGVSYQNLVGLLVEAIKEQQTQIDELKKNQENNDATNINANYPENITKPLLFQNAPNPFSEKTEIKYFIPTNALQASIFIYNMNGKQLKEFKITDHENGSIIIEGSQFEAGIYLYTLIVDQKEIETKHMILTK